MLDQMLRRSISRWYTQQSLRGSRNPLSCRPFAPTAGLLHPAFSHSPGPLRGRGKEVADASSRRHHGMPEGGGRRRRIRPPRRREPPDLRRALRRRHPPHPRAATRPAAATPPRATRRRPARSASRSPPSGPGATNLVTPICRRDDGLGPDRVHHRPGAHRAARHRRLPGGRHDRHHDADRQALAS